MNLRFTLVLFFVVPLLSRGQDNSVKTFTLQDCINYALDNSPDAQNALLGEQAAKAKVKETIGIGLPQVSGSVSAQKSPTLQRFFSTYDPNASFGISPDDAAALGINPGDVFAAQNFFQLKSGGDAHLQVDQLIFNGSYIVGLQASNAYKELAVKSSGQTRQEIVANVTKAYYNYLISKERMTLFDANIARVDSLYQTTIQMNKNGFAEKLDVDRLKVNLNNLKTERDNFANMYVLSYKLLKFQMNYPFSEGLVISGAITSDLFQPEPPIESDWSYQQRADYQVLLTNKKLQELNIRNKYAEALPTIGAFANLGYNTQSPTFTGLFKTESNFEGVPQVGPDEWYKYSTFGLRLSWNLFTGSQRFYQIQQEKIELEKINNNFEKFERSVDLEIEQNYLMLQNAISKLESQTENMELAKSIFNVTQIKYQQGVGSNLEVIEADTSLKEAQTNYYNAVYEAIIAKIDLQKSLGRLNQ